MQGELTDINTIEHYCVLLRQYGVLLSKRQEEIVRCFFQEDLSLAEIAEWIGISRQAVHDHLNRACEALDQYEAKLNSLARREAFIHDLEKIKDLQNIKEMSEAIELLIARLMNEGEP